MFWWAAFGATLFVIAAALLLSWAALSFEFPAPIVLPGWLEWARGALNVTLFWCGALVGVFAVVLLNRPSDLKRGLAFQGFAMTRGLQFARYGAQPAARGISFAEATDGAALASARSRSRGSAELNQSRFRANFALSQGQTLQEPDLQIAVANYTGGKNDAKGPRSAFRYLQLRVPRQLPHLMIDSLHNGRLRHLLPDTLRLSLEGDFDRHFAVYVSEGYERDALELLTPDVMASLIDFGRCWDVEMVEDRMIVVSGRIGRRHDREETSALLLFAEVVGAELSHQARSYTDPRAASPRTQVAEGGRRLRRRSAWWAASVVAVGVAVMFGYPFVLGWLLDR